MQSLCRADSEVALAAQTPIDESLATPDPHVSRESVSRGSALRSTTTRVNFLGARLRQHHRISVSGLSPSALAIDL